MSASYELLETLQADILAVLLATPALANCAIIADSDGDTESKVTKALAGTIKNRANKYGLAVIVLAPEVTSAEANLPGPPLLVRIDVQTLEHVQTNRGPSGTGLRSSHAAMIALSTLHLYQFGAHALYADKAPIEPLPATSGLVSHSISLYLRAGGIAVAAKPSQVQPQLLTGGALLVTGSLIPDATGVLVPAGLHEGQSAYSSDGGSYPSNYPWTRLAYDPEANDWVLGYYPNEGSFFGWRRATMLGSYAAQGDASGAATVAASGATPYLTLTCASPSSSIRTTTDGSYPSPSKTLYSGPFALPAAGTVVRAAAYVTGQAPSDILEFTVTE